MPASSRTTPALRGLLLGGAALLLVELGLRLVLGPPDPMVRAARAAPCALAKVGSEATFTCEGEPSVSWRGPVVPDRPRVVMLGGSSLQDPFYPHAQLPEAVGVMLPELEIINLARPGASVADLAETARESALLSPALLVVYTGHNDYAARTGAVTDSGARPMALRALLGRSWLFHGLEGLLGAPPIDAPPAPSRPGKSSGTPPPTPVSTDPGRCGVPEAGFHAPRVVEDPGALEARPEVEAHFREGLTALVAQSPAPVLLLIPIRNDDHPPLGTWTSTPDRCAALMACLAGPPPIGAASTLADLAQESCGDSAITAWLQARAAKEAGEPREAAHWRDRSLDLDALPVRAAASIRPLIRTVAAEGGASVFDLEAALGGWGQAAWFRDPIHLSQAGVEALAGVLAPAIAGQVATEGP